MTRVPVVCDDSRTFWTLIRDTLDRLSPGASKDCLRYDDFPEGATAITEARQVTHVRLGVRFDWIASS